VRFSRDLLLNYSFHDYNFIELFHDAIFQRLVAEPVVDRDLEGDGLVHSQTFGDRVGEDETDIELHRVVERNVDRNHETFGQDSSNNLCSKLTFKVIQICSTVDSA
jgi:hypothetical protein